MSNSIIGIDPIYIERPYDRGFPHKLRTARETAVITEISRIGSRIVECRSAMMAFRTALQKGVAWQRINIGDTVVYFDGSTPVKVSKKAAALLRKAAKPK
jgi:hypothetical protein